MNGECASHAASATCHQNETTARTSIFNAIEVASAQGSRLAACCLAQRRRTTERGRRVAADSDIVSHRSSVMTGTKFNLDSHLQFEHSFPRAPYERLRHSFRAQQKHIDREYSALSASAADLAAREYEPIDALATVDAMISRVESLLSKVKPPQSNPGVGFLTPLWNSLKATKRRGRSPQSVFCVPDSIISRNSRLATLRAMRYMSPGHRLGLTAGSSIGRCACEGNTLLLHLRQTVASRSVFNELLDGTY